MTPLVRNAIGVLAVLLLTAAARSSAQAAFAVPGFRQADNVAVVTIRGPIDRTTEYSIRRRLQLAEDDGADAIVFDLNTPGGEVGAVLSICNAIKTSAITNTVAWINPDAYSGGAIIALACREIVVAPTSSFGDALPVIQTLTGVQRATEVMPAQKLLPPLLAEVVDSARLRGWDEFLVQALVTDGIELWLVERRVSDTDSEGGEAGERDRYCINADEYRALFGREPPRGLPELVAATGTPSTLPAGPAEGEAFADTADTANDDGTDFRAASPELERVLNDRAEVDVNELDAMLRESTRPLFSRESPDDWIDVAYATDGSSAVVLRSADMARYGFSSAEIANDAELIAFFGAKNLSRVDRNWSEGLVAFLLNPIVRGVLIAVFLIGIFIELTNPGVVFAGLTAAIALFLAIAPAMLLGLATWIELVAIGSGLLLIMLEIFVVPGFGVFGLSGLAMLFGGLVWTFVGSSGGLFPDSPRDQADLLYGLTAVTLALGSAGVAFVFLPKKLHELPIFKKLVLGDEPTGSGEDLLEAMAVSTARGLAVGDEGVADSPLMPIGRGRFGDGLHEVRASLGVVDAGSRIRVVDASGMTPQVEPIAEETV
ncbi:MAG: ATP-dependent Clp protease proteolytic subunit [Planctomycetota bacterium]